MVIPSRAQECGGVGIFKKRWDEVKNREVIKAPDLQQGHPFPQACGPLSAKCGLFYIDVSGCQAEQCSGMALSFFMKSAHCFGHTIQKIC
jgi:hypothetical protein